MTSPDKQAVSGIAGIPSAHTPGPWLAEPADMFGDHNIVLCDGDDRRAVAAVVSNMRDESEVEANAKLIAAAPTILAALKAARAALHQHYVDWDGEPEDAAPLLLARDKCDDAIAKALGQ